jgi:hypothetical protein
MLCGYVNVDHHFFSCCSVEPHGEPMDEFNSSSFSAICITRVLQINHFGLLLYLYYCIGWYVKGCTQQKCKVPDGDGSIQYYQIHHTYLIISYDVLAGHIERALMPYTAAV